MGPLFWSSNCGAGLISNNQVLLVPQQQQTSTFFMKFYESIPKPQILYFVLTKLRIQSERISNRSVYPMLFSVKLSNCIGNFIIISDNTVCAAANTCNARDNKIYLNKCLQRFIPDSEKIVPFTHQCLELHKYVVIVLVMWKILPECL